MPNEQLKKEMVERGKGKIAKLIGRIAIYNDSKKADLCGARIKKSLPNITMRLGFSLVGV